MQIFMVIPGTQKSNKCMFFLDISTLSETAGLFRDISSLGLLEGFITQALD